MKLIAKLYLKIVVGSIKNSNREEPNVKEWSDFLSGFPNEYDYIDQSYFKYKCRLGYLSKWKIVLLNIGSIPFCLLMKISLWGKKKRLNRFEPGLLVIEKKNDVGYQDVIPEELLNVYANHKESPELIGLIKFSNLVFCEEAKEILKKTIKRRPWDFYYIFWAGKELSKHSFCLLNYNPEATAVYIEERNIASPLIRELYESSGRKYISFMHGEYLLQLIQSFMGFTEYYVWDKQYVDNFKNILRCSIGKYVIYTPQKLKKKYMFEKIESSVFCTYYFSGESRKSILKLKEIFDELSNSGHLCLIRPHPRYSDLNLIHSLFMDSVIENPSEVSIESSLGRTKYVIGLATTVLSEAYVEGKTIVIDDLSDPDKFNNLSERKFLPLQRPHILFSEFYEENKSSNNT